MLGPDEVRIETPEQIELGLEPVGPGTRFVGWLIDGLIKLVILAVLGLLALVLSSLTSQGRELIGLLSAIAGAVILLVLMAYDVFFEVFNNGQTPGKRVAGVRVIRDGGGPVDFISASLRWLLALIDSQPGFTYFIGATVMLMTPRRQRLGDLVAGTLVIRERAEAPLAGLNEEVRKLASEEFTFTPQQLTACTAGDRHLLRSYFQRYRGMDSRSRRDLAQRLTDALLERVPYEKAERIRDGRDAINFLASLYRDLETLHHNSG